MRSIYILNEQEVPVAVLNPELPDGCPVFTATHTERLEYGYLTFEFEVPANHPTAQHIAEGGFIIYPRESRNPDYFKIITVKDSNANGEYRKSIYAENAAVPELLGNPIRPATLNSYSLEQAMTYVLSGTGWLVGDIEHSGTKDLKFDDYTTSLDALHTILDAYGAEIEFVYEFNGLTVASRKINARIRRGNVINKPFVYSIDLAEVEREIDDSELVTALIGVGKGEGTSGNLTFTNYTPTGLDTTKYEKPSGADWVGNLDALQRWGKNGKHIYGIYNDDSATNATELFNNTLAALDKYSTPRITYKADVAVLANLVGYEAHKVQLGDTIVVKDETFQPELILEARIIEYKSNPFDPTEDAVTLGEFKPLLSSNIKSIRDIQNKITENVKKVMGTGVHVIANSPAPLVDGAYTNFNHSLTIEVTENVHIGHVSVFCDTAGQSGIIQLQLADGTVVDERTFSGLLAGENRLNLDFILLKDVKTYKLYGDFSGNTWRTDKGMQYPYDSGTFKVVGTSSGSGYWYHFYNISIGGSGVTGGLGRQMTIGENNNRLGTIQALNSEGDALFLVDKDQITMSKAVIGEVISPTVVNVATEATQAFYVDPTTGDDDNAGTSGAPLKTVSAAISRVPRVFDGKVDIFITGDITEDIDIMGYLGNGEMSLYFNGHNYTGTIRLLSVKARVNIYDGVINYRTGETNGPVQAFKSDYVYISGCTIRGKTGTGGTIACVQAYDSSFVYLYQSQLYNATTCLVRASFGAKVVVREVKGSGAPTGLRAEYAGLIAIAGYIPDCATDWDMLLGGQIVYQGTPTVDSGTGSTAPTPPQTASWSSTSGNSYRTRYNAWRNDGTVRQGQWDGYGHHTGCWFFPASLSSTLSGKTIKWMRIKIKRLNEGGNAYTTVTLRWHGHASQPSGAPTVSSEYINATFKRGEPREITLPASFYPYFQNGTAKGIALYTGNTTNAYYATFDDSATIYVGYV